MIQKGLHKKVEEELVEGLNPGCLTALTFRGCEGGLLCWLAVAEVSHIRT